MAQINTTFGFQDNISPGLRLVAESIKNVSSQLEQMRTVANTAGENVDNIGDHAEATGGKLEKLRKMLDLVNNGFQFFANIKGLLDGVTGKLGQLNGMYQAQADAEARLTTIMKQRMNASDEDVEKMNEWISNFSKGSTYSKTAITNAAQELGTYINSAETIKGLLPMLTSMSNQANISDGGLMGMATMIGKVMGGDMGGLTDRGWVFTKEEKEAFKLMSEYERLNFLVQTASESIGDQESAIVAMMATLAEQKELEDLQIKLGGVVGDFLDAVDRAGKTFEINFYRRIVPLCEQIIPYAAAITNAFVVGINVLFSVIDSLIQKLSQPIDYIRQQISQLAEFISNNANAILIMTTAVVSAIAASLVFLGLRFVWLKRESVAAAIASAAAWVVAHAPLAAIIAIIIGIISAIGLFLAFSEKTFAAVGAIIGSFVMFIQNAFISLKNFLMIWAEFFANLFNDPIGSLKRLVADFADDFLKKLQLITKPLDYITGKNWTVSIQSARDSLKAWRDSTITDKYIRTDKDDYTLNAVTTGWDMGAKVGGAFQDWVGGKIGALKGFIDDQKNKFLGTSELNAFDDGQKEIDITQSIKNALPTTNGGALKTKDEGMNNLEDEYKDFLSVMAADRFNFKFVQTVPQVNIDNLQVTDGEKSAKSFLTKLREGIEEYGYTAAVGF